MRLAFLVLVALVLFGRTPGSIAAPATGSVMAPRAVATWGSNDGGQLGENSTPIGGVRDVAGVADAGGATLFEDVVAVASNGSYNLVLDADGTVWAWGENGNGQLGRGTAGGRSTRPERVRDEAGTGVLSGIKAVSAGYFHALALSESGEVWAWGSDSDGQLGDGTPGGNRALPARVKDAAGNGILSAIVSIGGGNHHSVAADADGHAWTWGDNDHGQLGVGTINIDSALPLEVQNEAGTSVLGDVEQVATSWDHNIAMTSTGEVWVWGKNEDGQAGDGTKGAPKTRPVRVRDAAGTGFLGGVKALSAGYGHNFALGDDGKVWAWGNNDDGVIGDGGEGTAGSLDRLLPVRVKNPAGTGDLEGVTAIVAGDEHSLALVAGGQVLAWGEGQGGKLGLGPVVANEPLPQPVKGLAGDGPLKGAVDIAAGDYHSLAIVETAGASLGVKKLARRTTISVKVGATGAFPAVGYLLTESPAPPAIDSLLWQTEKPTTFTLSPGDGMKTVYAYVADSAFFVSPPAIARVRLDTTKPIVAISRPTQAASLTRLKTLAGTKSDPAPRSGLASARAAIRLKEGTRCRWWRPATERLVPAPCDTPLWFPLPAGQRWSKAIGTLDVPGRYAVVTRAKDRAGNVGRSSSRFTIVPAPSPSGNR